jgi:hypothetical protein
MFGGVYKELMDACNKIRLAAWVCLTSDFSRYSMRMRGGVLIFVLLAGGPSIVTAQQKKPCDNGSKADSEASLV